MPKRKKPPTQNEIDAILFASGSDSDISSEDDGWPTQNQNCSFIPDADSDEETMFNLLEDFNEDEEMDIVDEYSAENKSDAVEDFEFSPHVFTWSEEIKNDLITSELNNHAKGGPVHNLPVGSSADAFFKLLFTEEMCETIKTNTNKYAEFWKEMNKNVYEPVGTKKWKFVPITDTQELWNFFSIIIIMGIAKLPKLSDYWSSNGMLGNEKIKEIMTRDRFFQLYKFLHLSDRETELPPNHPDYYLMQKVDPFMQELKMNFQNHFEPYTELSIDEAMIKYKGRLGIIQYMPKKPVKRGIKVWMLCSSFLGYASDFEAYCGKKDRIPRSNHGLGFGGSRLRKHIPLSDFRSSLSIVQATLPINL